MVLYVPTRKEIEKDFSITKYTIKGSDPLHGREFYGYENSSMTLDTDYLIIGDRISNKTAKYNRALELKWLGKHIQAMTESEFWALAAKCESE